MCFAEAPSKRWLFTHGLATQTETDAKELFFGLKWDVCAYGKELENVFYDEVPDMPFYHYTGSETDSWEYSPIAVALGVQTDDPGDKSVPTKRVVFDKHTTTEQQEEEQDEEEEEEQDDRDFDDEDDEDEEKREL